VGEKVAEGRMRGRLTVASTVHNAGQGCLVTLAKNVFVHLATPPSSGFATFSPAKNAGGEGARFERAADKGGRNAR